MASFQVEIPPPSPFACAAVHNLNKLDITDLWVHQPQWQAGSASASTSGSASTSAPALNTNNNAPCDASDAAPSKPKDNWARAREIVFPANTTPPKHPTSVDVSNAGGVSSLVQKWKGFEAGAKRPPPPPPPPDAPALICDDDSIFGDWESDRTVLSGRSSMRGRDSDAAESERLRVADIIRKLTPNEVGSVSPPRSRSSLDQADLRCPLPPIPGPRHRTSLDLPELRCQPAPRIRGRQAYIDLLAQAERDRRHELQALLTRKPVSTFPHRGRIQAALKIKLLRRGIETKEVHVHFRERANAKAPIRPGSRSKDTTANSNSNSAQQTTDCLRPPKDDHHTDSQHCATTSQHQEIHHTYEDFQHAESSFPRQEHNWESSSSKSAEIDSAEAPKPLDLSEIKKDEETIEETAAYWVSDASHTEEGWEEFHYDDDHPHEANHTDWIEMVSRPRSDWEYLRQERYQEMLDPFMDNEDIRQLLGRKSVSSFLSSGMREKIDQLMISRSQGKQPPTSNLRLERRQEEITDKERRVDEEYGEYFQEYEEAESSQHYTECDSFSQSTTATWSQNQNQKQGGHEPSECSYQAVSPSTQQSSSHDINGRNSSFPSIEMDLIYDLRRHMEQLHQEISELRKSIQCSNELQMKLQRSIKQEVAACFDQHQVKKETGRKCCMCSKARVECVLYRCGHMCTCFDCAHELHWNSGACPICRAEIVDVIHTNSNW